MKSNLLLIIGLALLLVGIGGLVIMCCGSHSMGGGMGMMSGKEMMKRVMGDQLPLGIDATDLPEPKSHGAQLLARYCIQCHDLPPPVLHNAVEGVGAHGAAHGDDGANGINPQPNGSGTSSHTELPATTRYRCS